MYIDYEYANKNKGLWPKGYVKKKRSTEYLHIQSIPTHREWLFLFATILNVIYRTL